MALPLSLGQLGYTPSIAEDSGRGNKNALKAKGSRLGRRGARGSGRPGRRRWAAQHGLGGCECEEGFSLDDLLEVLARATKKRSGREFTGDKRERRAPQQAFQLGF